MNALKAEHRVEELANALEVSVSGFYARIARGPGRINN
jgi:hypothetical protein